MISVIEKPSCAAPLFKDWKNTLISSCLDGTMGYIYGNNPVNPVSAAACIGTFRFFAGRPDRELLFLKTPMGVDYFAICVPQTEQWAELIENTFGERALKTTRYCFEQDISIFDRNKLRAAVNSLDGRYTLLPFDRDIYELVSENQWLFDCTVHYPSYELYRSSALGYAVVRDGEIVAAASTYSHYNGGINIVMHTRADHRHRGLAYACCASVILDCLDRGIYPSIDANGETAAALAEKLGYRRSSVYSAYEVKLKKH